MIFVGTIESLFRRYPVLVQLARFVGIGVLNTALDFIIFNFLSKQFSVDRGVALVLVNAVGFTAAVIQSYVWNRSWIFSTSALAGSLFNQVGKLILVGGLGAVAMVAVLVGAKYQFGPSFYLVILTLFLILQLLLWKGFGLSRATGVLSMPGQFTVFLLVSVIGYALNSGMVYAGVAILPGLGLSLNPDLLKNTAKIIATLVSLVWNFLGYKLFVFKR